MEKLRYWLKVQSKSIWTLIAVALFTTAFLAGCGGNNAAPAVSSKNGDANKAAEESVNKVRFGQKTKIISAYTGNAPVTPDIQRIQKRGKLIVAMYYQDRPPWFYQDKQGQLAGIDVDMAQDIAQELGVDVEFDRVARSFNEVVDRVAKGQADLAISKLSVTLARAQRIRYTQPYIIFNQALLVNRLKMAAVQKANPGKPALELLLNTTDKIGVAKGTSYEEFARDIFAKARITAIPEQGYFAATAAGEVLAALYDENEIAMYMKENPELSITTKVIVLTDRIDPIAIAVAPQDEQLLSWLNHYLDFLKSREDINQQLVDYIGGLK